MYGIYGDIIYAAEKALLSFGETEELLEYPEVQADKAYYLSVLSKYNNLRLIKDKTDELKTALEEKRAARELFSGASDEEARAAVYEEISAFEKIAAKASAELADALGCKHAEESAYCRFKLTDASAKFGTALFSLIKSYFAATGATVREEKTVYGNGGNIREISFVAEGADVITRLAPLSGAHKVYIAKAKSEELCFAATPAATVEELRESDLKIDLFHSHGKGGQNVNKVETAVRVTHIPTGLSVVCQDERSQLKNKKRAVETLEKRFKERSVQAEKKRMEADVAAQFSVKNTAISFDLATDSFTDTRLKGFTKIPFPMTDTEFTSYINGLIAL